MMPQDVQLSSPQGQAPCHRENQEFSLISAQTLNEMKAVGEGDKSCLENAGIK